MTEDAEPVIPAGVVKVSPPAVVSNGGATSSARPHVAALDGVRGLAILLVMVFHFFPEAAGPDVPAFVREVVGVGWSGVDLFFVLSGFLITGNLLAAKGSPRFFRNFYARRALRIFPLYYAVLAVFFLAAPWLSRIDSTRVAYVVDHQLWLWLYAANILIVKNHGFILASVNHFWSLAVEEHFYLVWPALVFFSTRRGLAVACVVVMTIALGLRCVLTFGHLVDGPAAYVLTPCRMDGLALGALLAVATESRPIATWAPLARRVGLASAVALAAFWVVRGGLVAGDPWLSSIGYSVIAVFYASLLVASVAAQGGTRLARVATWGPLRTLGTYAYGLYVFHFPIQIVCERAVPYARLRTMVGAIPAIGLHMLFVFGVCFGVSWASWHLFEKRFLALKRYF